MTALDVRDLSEGWRTLFSDNTALLCSLLSDEIADMQSEAIDARRVPKAPVNDEVEERLVDARRKFLLGENREILKSASKLDKEVLPLDTFQI